MPAEIVVEPLESHHQKADFSCGHAELDDFIRTKAKNHAKKGFGRTYVAIEAGRTTVLGYFTLSMGSVSFENVGDEIRARLPRYPMPVVHLGKLAVDSRQQGQGIGARLLREALELSVLAAGSVGAHAIEVVAIDEAAMSFYLHYGFTPLKTDLKHLYLPLKDVVAAQHR